MEVLNIVTTCSNCDSPVVHVGNLCRICYKYKKRRGVNRPKALIERAKKRNCGICECGEPARHLVKVTMNAPKHTVHAVLRLCDRCRELEREMWE